MVANMNANAVISINILFTKVLAIVDMHSSVSAPYTTTCKCMNPSVD
jgi:hypothetical protein